MNIQELLGQVVEVKITTQGKAIGAGNYGETTKVLPLCAVVELLGLTDNMTSIVRMPNAEHEADGHNQALRSLRIAQAQLGAVDIKEAKIGEFMRVCHKGSNRDGHQAELVAKGWSAAGESEWFLKFSNGEISPYPPSFLATP